MKNNQENTNAFLIHISAFGGFFFPFGNIITPLIAWQTLKDRSVFLDEQGKEAVNFNISYTLYGFLASILFIPFSLRNIFNNSRFFRWNDWHFSLDFTDIFGFIGFGTVISLIYILGIILVIIASLKAKDGENYKYPFTIKFIK